MQIRFEDYGRENKPFLKQILFNITRVSNLKSEYEHEKYVQEFEHEFANYNKSQYAIGVNSGTTALQLALKASDIEEGDEVIVPSYTYIATALAISNLGAKPVFVDIKRDTLTINPDEIEKKITKKTKGMIPVHIHGNPCDMEKIKKIAKKNNLKIIEDASHAHGAEYKGIKVGNFGIGCFSNHSSKILSGVGNSGLITTNDINIYTSIKRMIKVTNEPDLNISKRTPCNMNALQAAILKAKLPYLNELINKRIKNASLYIKNLSGLVKFQKEEKNSKHVYRDFAILVKNREKLMRYLEDAGIETKIRYRIPLHLTKYYKKLGYKKGDLPVTDEIFKKLLWLPIPYSLSKKEINYTCDKICKFYQHI
jgi:hypothetical protein